MKTSLVMNYNVDRDKRVIKIEREFAAPLSMVWNAWTDSNILDQWWAPKPWQARTKKMDFKNGGYWLYAMIGPDGSQNWARADYKDILPEKEFNGIDAFCDENGNINHTFPIAYWKVRFTENGNSTMVNIEITYDSLEDLDKYIELGFREGLTAAMENLDELLK